MQCDQVVREILRQNHGSLPDEYRQVDPTISVLHNGITKFRDNTLLVHMNGYISSPHDNGLKMDNYTTMLLVNGYISISIF
jgi:hypothetical protein